MNLTNGSQQIENNNNTYNSNRSIKSVVLNNVYFSIEITHRILYYL